MKAAMTVEIWFLIYANRMVQVGMKMIEKAQTRKNLKLTETFKKVFDKKFDTTVNEAIYFSELFSKGVVVEGVYSGFTWSIVISKNEATEDAILLTYSRHDSGLSRSLSLDINTIS